MSNTNPLGRLAGKIALVTGAGAGIGREICLAFKREGAKVVCLDIDMASADDVARGVGDTALAVRCDVADPFAVKQAVDAVEQRFGALHVLVNNAAVFDAIGSIETLDFAKWNRALAVNVSGAMLMSRHSVPLMRKHGGGSIIHVASQLGHVGKQGRACYCVTKAALIHLATTMAIDHAGDGIRVNSLSPGPISTDRGVQRYGGAEAHATGLGPLTLLQRTGTAREIANAALFLASDESSYVTGTDLLVDGGYLAR